MSKYTANQDIRDYMADHGVSQRALASELGISVFTMCNRLKTELSESDKETYLRIIDELSTKQFSKEIFNEVVPAEEPETFEEEECTEQESDQKFQIGDRVKYPASTLKIGIVADIWQSFASAMRMYTVRDEGDGHCAMFAETQLEPAPLPIEYRFEAHIDGNVAVSTMIAVQGEKEWIYARGHAHIIHDGPVGLAQAISYSSKRMFESLDKQQENKIYAK
jgi:hypothetical protein